MYHLLLFYNYSITEQKTNIFYYINSFLIQLLQTIYSTIITLILLPLLFIFHHYKLHLTAIMKSLKGFQEPEYSWYGVWIQLHNSQKKIQLEKSWTNRMTTKCWKAGKLPSFRESNERINEIHMVYWEHVAKIIVVKTVY